MTPRVLQQLYGGTGNILFNIVPIWQFFRNIKSVSYMKFRIRDVHKRIDIRTHSSTKNNIKKLKQSFHEDSEYST